MDKSLSLEGQFLIAMPGMGDQRFEKSVIFICAHSEEGAMGFIVNQTMQSPTVLEFFKQLEIVNETELAAVPAEISKLVLHMGGPVEPGRGFVLHSEEFRSDSSLRVEGDIYLTATLEILRAISTGQGPKRLMLALGYSGWAAGQLEEEIVSNGWLTSKASSDILFDSSNNSKHERALASLGIDPRLLSSDSGHA